MAGWVANALFLVTAVPSAAGVDAFVGPAIVVALALFLASLVAFAYAFVVAAARTADGDDVVVSNLFFLQGSAPTPVRRQFLAVFLVCTVIACATVVWAPFGILVPMLPIGLAGVWAARHGTFPPRLPPTRR